MIDLTYLREEQQRVRIAVDAAFPPGTRVWPVGVTTGNWGGTVAKRGENDRRRTAADFVFVEWDNGNRYAVAVDEIERREGAE